MKINLIFRSFAVIALFFAFLSAPLFGQRPMDIDEIKVVAPYEPSVSDAFKINDNPRIDDTLTTKPSFTYNIMPRMLSTRFELEPIAAARMRGEPLAKLYQGHIRGGFGSYTTPYGEAFFNTLRSNEYALGLHLRHLSSSGTIKDHGYSGYSDNLARIFGKRYLGSNTLKGSLGFDRNVIHYYGFEPDSYADNPIVQPVIDDLTRKDIRQGINQLNAAVGFGSHHPDSTRLGYNTALEYNWLYDRYDAAEHNILFKGNIGREFNDPTGYADQLYGALNVKTDFYHTINPSDTSNTAIISLAPSATARLNRFNIHLGVDFSVQSDTASYLRVYPNIGLDAKLIDRYLTAHLSFTGGLQRHSLRKLLQENPFLNTSAGLGFMNTKTELKGGIKGAFSDNVSYSLSLGGAKIDNFAYFVTDTAALLDNKFVLAYDDIRRLHARGELFAKFGSRFNARLGADYFQYSPTLELEAWHLPTMLMSLNLQYNMQDKIIISGDFFARNASYGRSFEAGVPVAVKLHNFHVDANLGIEYRYTPILSFFVNLQNVQNKSLERWLNYPSQRFNIMGGLSWSF